MDKDARTGYILAYECVGLDIDETVAEQLPYLKQVVDRAQKRAAQVRAAGSSVNLFVGVDVIGGTRQQGAQATREVFDAACGMVRDDDHIYVAWNEHDEPRYVRDHLLGLGNVSVGGVEFSLGAPEVSALRFEGNTEFEGLDDRGS
jgi:hypothetical protein